MYCRSLHLLADIVFHGGGVGQACAGFIGQTEAWAEASSRGCAAAVVWRLSGYTVTYRWHAREVTGAGKDGCGGKG